jgi:uncharacterized membrane protein HdeD (DUF308 family)
MLMGIYDREEAVERSRRCVKIGAVILIASGTLSIIMPRVEGLAISLVFGLTILAAGLAHGILALSFRTRGIFLWRMLVSVAFLVAATCLIAQPDIAPGSLGTVIAISFLIEGVAGLAYFVIARTQSGSGWAVANALLTISLAFLVCWDRSRSSAWIQGTIVGVNLIASGLTWIILQSLTDYSYH